ncbi:unnamed protein product, partial [Musa acuminata subsp. burmannicoides]
MACSSLLAAPTSLSSRPAASPSPSLVATIANAVPGSSQAVSRRELAVILSSSVALLLVPVPPSAIAASDEEYVRETADMIGKLRITIGMDKKDANVAAAVADLREASNSWVAKYRREKALLGRASFRDMYSALNAVSGHYISFGPTSPIPAKRKTRILEEVDAAEKALIRGRMRSIDLVALLRAAALLWAVVTARDRTVKSRGLPWSSDLPRAAVALAAALRAPTTAVGNGGCDSPVEGGDFRRPSRGALLTA